MKRFALCVLGLHLAVVPCLADVIPSRRPETDPRAEQTVKARLEQLGMSPTDAQRHVGDLTSRETAYFAQSPNRIQVAGSLYWYEWLMGAGVVVFVAAIYIGLGVRFE